MCGRFCMTIEPKELREILGLEPVEFTPRYNIAPGQNVLTLVGGKKTQAVFTRWGLIPHWAKDITIGYKMINARAETLTEKPSFRDLLWSRRCLIPADGFYEWKQSGKSKHPFRFVMGDRKAFAFAGLWGTWMAPTKDVIHSCTIITTKPNELVAEIHDRMPVILRPEHYGVWLDHRLPRDFPLHELLAPYPSGEMECHEVSPLVTPERNDFPEVLGV